MLIFGSLFTGIGGLDLGLEWAGLRCAWQVEHDAGKRRLLARHWPGIPRLGDIRLVRGEDLEPVDLVCGGFPCQDISTAGKGAGIGGERSGLWREMLRLVRELRPRWVLVENVAALRTRGADVVLGDLEAAGYACWPLVVGAWAVGAPHRRDRVWIIALLPDAADPAARSSPLVPDAGREQERAARRRRARRRWVAGRDRRRHRWEPPPTGEPGMARSADGIPAGVALAWLAHACVPQIPEALGRAILAVERAGAGRRRRDGREGAVGAPPA